MLAIGIADIKNETVAIAILSTGVAFSGLAISGLYCLEHSRERQRYLVLTCRIFRFAFWDIAKIC